MLASTNAHDVLDLQRCYLPHVHPEMIQQRLKLCGLKAYIYWKNPLLTTVHKKKWLAWAQAHAHWTTEDWMSVIFSDESKFTLIRSDGCNWCWRRPGEEFNARYMKKVEHGGRCAMVWGCIIATGLGQLCHIEGNMDAKLYCKILEDELLVTLSNLGIKKKDIYFQQDNNPKHTSKLATDWFQKNKIDKLDWSPNSSDINIIKHAWDHLNRRVCSRSPLLNILEELWEALVEEWGMIENDYIKKLYKSMPWWEQALLEARGWVIPGTRKDICIYCKINVIPSETVDQYRIQKWNAQHSSDWSLIFYLITSSNHIIFIVYILHTLDYPLQLILDVLCWNVMREASLYENMHMVHYIIESLQMDTCY